jgi:hypothetical protein
MVHRSHRVTANPISNTNTTSGKFPSQLGVKEFSQEQMSPPELGKN